MNERADPDRLEIDGPFRSPEAHQAYLNRVAARGRKIEEDARQREANRIKAQCPPINLSLTHGEYMQMTEEERIADSKAWLERAAKRSQLRQAIYEDGDLEFVGSRQRYEAGE